MTASFHSFDPVTPYLAATAARARDISCHTCKVPAPIRSEE
jgi:hypothetical protein